MKVFWEKRGSFRFVLPGCYPDMVREDIYAYRILPDYDFWVFQIAIAI